MSEIEQAIEEAMQDIEKPKRKRAVQAKPLTGADVFFMLVIVVGLPLMLFLAGAKIGLGD